MKPKIHSSFVSSKPPNDVNCIPYFTQIFYTVFHLTTFSVYGGYVGGLSFSRGLNYPAFSWPLGPFCAIIDYLGRKATFCGSIYISSFLGQLQRYSSKTPPHSYGEQHTAAEKARLLRDHCVLQRCLRTSDRKHIKYLRSSARGFDHTRWVEGRLGLIFSNTYAKLKPRNDLNRHLLATADHILLELAPTPCLYRSRRFRSYCFLSRSVAIL